MLNTRRGFTLIELLVTMTLLTLVGGAIVTLLLRQQRFYNSTQAVIETRQQIRQAAAMLPGDLRVLSGKGGDIYSMTDSSIDFRWTFGYGIVCFNNKGKSTLNLVPLKLLKGSVDVGWSALPAANDSVLVYNDSTDISTADDAWTPYQMKSDSALPGASANCNNTTGLVQPADLFTANTVYGIVLTVAPTANIDIGAAVRFFKHVHYSIYHAADGNWYLGYYDCKPNRVPVCATISAVAGPFNAYAAAGAGTSGVQFSYYDTAGVVTAVPANVARISLVARGQSSSLVNLSGTGGKIFSDSIRIEVGLRNRK